MFTADPPVTSFRTAGGEGRLRILKDPPSTTATAVRNGAWITLTGGPVSNPSGTYFFYTVAPNTGAARTGTITVGNAVHTIDQAGSGGGFSVSRTSVPFGAAADRTHFTPAQDVQVTFTGPGAAGTTWSASSNQPWLSVTPAAGTGSGTVTLSLVPLGIPPAGTYTATVTIATGASSQTVSVPLRVMPPTGTAAPFGVVDQPANGETNRYGAIGVTGWALDDIEVSRVSLWRNPVPGEAALPNGHVYIGDAVFLDGARPDVGAAHPSYPLNTRGGWGSQVLTNMLPNTNGQPGTGNGTYTLYAYAHDAEGKTKLPGAPSIPVNNAASTRPFGTLDIPENGGEVSGIITVWGWALTPQPAIIPTDGSTIWVFVDRVSVGRPVYNLFRPDIARLFPCYANTNEHERGGRLLLSGHDEAIRRPAFDSVERDG